MKPTTIPLFTLFTSNAVRTHLLTTVFICLFCISCLTMKTQIIQTKTNLQSQNIIPGKGVGKLILNESNKVDVEKYLGKGKKIKYIGTFSNHSSQIIKFVYSNIGIEVEYSNLKNPKNSDTLKTIRFKAPCDFATIEGIKLGTTRREVENYLGNPSSSHYDKLLEDIYHAISYDGIEFIFGNNENSAEKMDCKVTEIIIWVNTDRHIK